MVFEIDFSTFEFLLYSKIGKNNGIKIFILLSNYKPIYNKSIYYFWGYKYASNNNSK